MGLYKINVQAEEDLNRIWRRGVRDFGEEQADKYYFAFFTRFEAIADNPNLYPAVEREEGYRRSVCGVDSIYYLVNHEGVEIMRILGQQDIDEWSREGIVEYLGETADVRPYLTNCSVFVLPSAYREGIPRTILEAMSTGRAVITTDAPGCADPVIEGETGFVVPVRNPGKLCEAMTRFVENPELIDRMGQASRDRAVSDFDVRRINTILLRKMSLLAADEVL